MLQSTYPNELVAINQFLYENSVELATRMFKQMSPQRSFKIEVVQGWMKNIGSLANQHNDVLK